MEQEELEALLAKYNEDIEKQINETEEVKTKILEARAKTNMKEQQRTELENEKETLKGKITEKKS